MSEVFVEGMPWDVFPFFGHEQGKSSIGGCLFCHGYCATLKGRDGF